MDHKNIAASFNLPRYYSSTPSPDYSYELSSGERLLEYTPHQSSFTRPSSVYIRKEGGTTIILNDQEEGIAIPKYGRQGTISGTLCFEQNDNILEVTVKVPISTLFTDPRSYELILWRRRYKEQWISSSHRVALNQSRFLKSAIPCGHKLLRNRSHPFAQLKSHSRASYQRLLKRTTIVHCPCLLPTAHHIFIWLHLKQKSLTSCK